jgi:hypothetical protein
MAAYALAEALEFDFVGLVDADQAPRESYYYETIFEEFDRNPRLGVASGFVYERPSGMWESRSANATDSVAGSAIFRRSCFDQVGGYIPLYYGGSDWLIQIDAKMAGWEIMTRPDLHILHYRPTSSAGGIWRGKFRNGLEDASFGSDLVFEFVKCCRRISSHPVLFGTFVHFCGYLWGKFTAPPLNSSRKSSLSQERATRQAAKMGTSWGTDLANPAHGGGSGIRTHGSLRIAGFQDRCFKPLSHPSSFGFQTRFDSFSMALGQPILCRLLPVVAKIWKMRITAHGAPNIAITSV